MFKKILIYFGYTLLFASLAAYFFFSTLLTKQEIAKMKCNQIEIAILDSSINRFVSREEIGELIREDGITLKESKLKHINLHNLELLLNNRTAIKKSTVSYTGRGVLKVSITQRRPVLRLETANGGFYMDETAYVFPLVRAFTSDVPVVTGDIPLNIIQGYRGKIRENKEWVRDILKIGLYIHGNEIWDAQIEQIFVDEKGNLHMTPRVGQHDIMFGKPEDIDNKFAKLLSFYKNIIPNVGWDQYNVVDLQYSNQIVCKKRKIKHEKT